MNPKPFTRDFYIVMIESILKQTGGNIPSGYMTAKRQYDYYFMKELNEDLLEYNYNVYKTTKFHPLLYNSSSNYDAPQLQIFNGFKYEQLEEKQLKSLSTPELENIYNEMKKMYHYEGCLMELFDYYAVINEYDPSLLQYFLYEFKNLKDPTRTHQRGIYWVKSILNDPNYNIMHSKYRAIAMDIKYKQLIEKQQKESEDQQEEIKTLRAEIAYLTNKFNALNLNTSKALIKLTESIMKLEKRD